MEQLLEADAQGASVFKVLQEGEVSAGDGIEVMEHGADQLTIADINRLYADRNDDLDGLRRAARLAALPEKWRARFRERVEKIQKQ